MANPLFNALGQNQPNNNNDFSQIIAEVQKLQSTFSGNPEVKVKRLIETGQMSQEQFNQLAQIANQIRAMMPQ